MILDWQNLAALGLVVSAAVYVVWRLIRAVRRRGASGCGSCPACPANQTPLISIDPPKG